MSCDQDENFFVHFDDERWQQHLPSLKPLGLNILLNTCNESVEDSYTKFADHLLCVSSLENHSIAVVNRRFVTSPIPPPIATHCYFPPPQIYLCMGEENHNLCYVFFLQILPNLHSLLHFIFNITFYKGEGCSKTRAIIRSRTLHPNF